jgi:hypothetical protein
MTQTNQDKIKQAQAKQKEEDKKKAESRTFVNEDATMSAFGLKPLEIPENKK